MPFPMRIKEETLERKALREAEKNAETLDLGNGEGEKVFTRELGLGSGFFRVQATEREKASFDLLLL